MIVRHTRVVQVVFVCCTVALVVFGFALQAFAADEASGEKKELVCAFTDENGKLDDDATRDGNSVIKEQKFDSVKAAAQGANDFVQNGKQETTDSVSIQADGTLFVASECGEKGTFGRVNFCLPEQRRNQCAQIDKQLKDWRNVKDNTDIKKGLQDLFADDVRNRIQEVAKNFKNKKELPKEYADSLNPLLDKLASGEKPLLCTIPNDTCRSGALNKLRELSQTDIANALEAVANKDVGKLNGLLEKAKIGTRLDKDDIAKLSDAIRNEGAGITNEGLCAGITGTGCTDNFKNTLIPTKGVRGFDGGKTDTSETDRSDTDKTPPKREKFRVLVPTKTIDRFEKNFPGLRAHMEKLINNSAVFSDEVKKILTDRMIAFACNVEAPGCNARAVSPTGASGLWQFTQGTARDMGLSLSDRFDAFKSTEAAIRLAEKRWPDIADAVKSSGIDPAVAVFLAHNLGTGTPGRGGGPAGRIIRAFTTNPNMSARAAINNDGIWVHNRGVYGGTVAQAVETISSRISGDKSRAGAFANGFSPYNGRSPFSTGGLGGGGGGLGNIFSSLGNLFGGNRGENGSQQQTQPRMNGNTQTPVRNTPARPSPAVENVVNILEEEAKEDEPVEIQEPVIALSVLPATVAKGDSLNIVWSALRVSESEECQLRMESTLSEGVLETGNEGRRVVPVPPTTTITELRFKLVCTPSDSRADSKNAEVEAIVKVQ